MSGHYVHIPKGGHRCELPDREGVVLGSIWLCDDCQLYWKFRHTDESWGPVWDCLFWRTTWESWRRRMK